MKLTNILIDDRKILDYILNYDHEQGRNKAKVFESALNITLKNHLLLVNALRKATQQQEVIPIEKNKYGQKYQLDFMMSNGGKSVMVRSIWIVKNGENFARLVTCYVN